MTGILLTDASNHHRPSSDSSGQCTPDTVAPDSAFNIFKNGIFFLSPLALFGGAENPENIEQAPAVDSEL